MAATPSDAQHPAMRSEGSGSIETALRHAFPHFQNDEPITPESIRAIGDEYIEMVMGWQPLPKEIAFLDQNDVERKIVYEEGDDDANSGWCMPEYADWQVSPLPAAIAEATLPAAHGAVTGEPETAKPINPDPPKDFGAFITKTI